ncbi:MAG: ABC transporter permease, partial [Acidobacteriota bacterium]|nr:ABC transporter permease [Acidobacteriota bacterium]
MRALNRKLLRDLWNIKGQVFAISMVITVGIAMFIAYFSTFASLQRTQQTFYDRYHFAEVFANMKRAPNHLERKIIEIPGVSRVATRVVAEVTVDVADMDEPVTGRLISIPPDPSTILNGIALLQGRFPEAERADEIVAGEGFALAHDLRPGSTIDAVINGRKRTLEIVGIGLSPEYIYSIRAGDLMPDNARFGIFWMGRRALATAFDMEGGFNDVSLRLTADASEQDVLARLDRLLEPYGGLGAIPRARQTSHWYLNSELIQLRGFGTFVPVIFLGVAAFLLNVVLRRIISVQRVQIAALKALGYANREIGLHYASWSLLITIVGGIGGLFAG